MAELLSPKAEFHVQFNGSLSDFMADSLESRDCHNGFVETGDDIYLKESGSDDFGDQKVEYPSAIKLFPIIIGLCFQSFCVALVRE